MKLLPTVEKLIDRIGIKKHDCHPGLERDEEYRGLGIGGGAISIEEAMLIIGLIWAVRPDFVIELGTFNAGSSLVLAAACRDLGKGHVITVDLAERPYPKAHLIAAELNLPLRFVNSTNSLDFLDSFEVQNDLKYLVFSDTEIDIRPIEVLKVINTYPSGTMIAVHDTNENHPFGPMNLKEKINEVTYGDIDIVEMPSPRGLSILKV